MSLRSSCASTLSGSMSLLIFLIEELRSSSTDLGSMSRVIFLREELRSDLTSALSILRFIEPCGIGADPAEKA